MVKTIVLILIATTIGGVGHVLLAKGMRGVGDLTEVSSDLLLRMIARAVASPWVLFGVTLQASFFFLYLSLLSRADVSLVLPLTALDYIVVSLLAHFALGEPVTVTRWAGISLIVVGVALVSRT